MSDDPEAGDDAQDVELSASADGTLHISLKLPMEGEQATEEEPPDPGQNDDPGPDVIGGAAKVAGKVAGCVLGTIWDAVKSESE